MIGLRTLVAIPLASVLAACMVVPVVDSNDSSSSCNTYTKSMTLKTVALESGKVYCNDEACLAVILAVSAGSVIVSGSIVLTNNTVHWLEYQGTCNDSYLNTAKQHFLDSLGNPKPVPTKQL